MTLDQLARQIASDLFTNGQGERADRLVLVTDAVPPRNLGGWSEEALADQIEEHLSNALGPDWPELAEP